MREIKLREPTTDQWGVFNGFHYWGIIDGVFIPPRNEYGESAKRSQRFTGFDDLNGKEVYEGDPIHKEEDGTIWTVEFDDSIGAFTCFNGLNSVRLFSFDHSDYSKCPIVRVNSDYSFKPEIINAE